MCILNAFSEKKAGENVWNHRNEKGWKTGWRVDEVLDFKSKIYYDLRLPLKSQIRKKINFQIQYFNFNNPKKQKKNLWI